MTFTYHLPVKIIVGGPAHKVLEAELEALGMQRLLLVSDPGLDELGLVGDLAAGLSTAGRTVSVFTQVSSNPTTEEVAAGLAQARTERVQAVISLGGGSPIDVGKAIAMLMANGGCYADYQWGGRPISQRSLPLFALPTTAGTGSEVSKVAVIVDPERPFKKGVLSPLMFPYAAILDPELTRSLPPHLTAATGMDAFIHALEAYTGRRAQPYSDMLALAALEAVWQSLPRAVQTGQDMEARERMMLAALWAGTAMDHAGLGLIHSLSGPLTGLFHLHHGLANAILLPPTLRFNLPEIDPQRLARLKHLVGLDTEAKDEALIDILTAFIQDIGLTTRLSEVADISLLGDETVLEQIATDTVAMAMTPNNPRCVSAGDVITLVRSMITV